MPKHYLVSIIIATLAGIICGLSLGSGKAHGGVFDYHSDLSAINVSLKEIVVVLKTSRK